MEHHTQRFNEFLAPTTSEPLALEITSAEGLYLYDVDGKEYMDLISGLAVTNIGHRHPKVIAAVKDQLDRYLHLIPYGEFIQHPQTLLAEKLASILPDHLSTSYFVNSGTEANEAAIKLAKRITGRMEIIAFRGAYHGSTHGSLSISGNEVKKRAFRPLLPDVHFLPYNVVADLDMISEKTAAVIIEPIQGDAGIRIPSDEYIQLLRKKCAEFGALLIFDEIQTGFGRTGTMFAFEQFGVAPDILTLAKAMGGGMPIGAFVSSRENMQHLQHDPMLGHITTFGGHPVNCAAALANIQVLEEEKLISAVKEKEALFRSLLIHPKIKEVRSKGLFFAIEMEDFETVHKTVLKGLDKGFISFWFLSCKDSFRIAPPLTITEEEIHKACSLILEAMDAA